MKKVIALGLATVFSVSLDGNPINWNTANTFLRFETPFQSASPERLALFNTEDKRTKHRAHHNGDVQFVVFGGQNSNQADAAAYYLPGGLETLTFNSSITDTQLTYWSNGVQGGVTAAQIASTAGAGVMGAATGSGQLYTPLQAGLSTTALGSLTYYNGSATTSLLASDTLVANAFVVGQSATTSTAVNLNDVTGLVVNNPNIGNFVIDSNKNIGIMRPWNFGVGYAPNVQVGSAITQSTFLSTLTPTLKRSQWGIGATWKQLLSADKDTGFFLELSTALQRVTMNFDLGEIVSEALVLGDVPAWENQGFDTGDVPQPTNMTQAFAQAAWEFGRVDGPQSVTRLADIELKLGYQFVCNENVMANSFIGIVIPTGNKAQSLYLAEPIVGNGFHFGLMFGSTAEIQLDMGSETRWSMRSDANFRYLFQNTQVRSFDTMSNGQWSRYMMVWPNYATEQANGELASVENAMRQFTPGINVFTQEVHVSPGAQTRMNQALVIEHGSFKGELGWNLMVRQAENVSLVNEWVDNAVAFVDASNSGSSLYNATRTIYNDAYQSTPLATTAGLSEAAYNAASISASDLNIDSAASPFAYTNTPYLAVGYAFNEEKSSVFSIGISYELSATNGYINDWTLWGKFGFTF